MSHMLHTSGINECFANMGAAINGEVRMTSWMRSKGFEIDVFEYAFHSNDGPVRRKKHNVTMSTNGKQSSENYALTDWSIGQKIDPSTIPSNPHPFDFGCMGEDTNSDKGYFGIDLSPWEIMFTKSDRGINPLMYELATGWVDGSGYSSYDYCL